MELELSNCGYARTGCDVDQSGAEHACLLDPREDSCRDESRAGSVSSVHTGNLKTGTGKHGVHIENAEHSSAYPFLNRW